MLNRMEMASRLSNWPLALSSAIYYYFHPCRDAVLITSDDGLWKAKNMRAGLTLYYPTPLLGLRITSAALEKYDNYRLIGQVEPTPEDIVVDVGSFVGEFATMASTIADRVVAIEPDLRSYKCLEMNARGLDNVQTENALLTHDGGEVKFLLGEDPTENSLIDIDRGAASGSEIQSSNKLSEICDRNGIGTIDFLKLDAEGAEPEVLRGRQDITIRKMAIECGPERKGERTEPQIRDMLPSLDHRYIQTKNGVLFSKLEE